MATFELSQAHHLLPKIQEMTAKAVTAADELMLAAQAFPEGHAERVDVEKRLKVLIEDWVQAMTDLGLHAKGLWLVDFDSGEGYWCWKHPEPSIEYWHSYDEGFGGRKLITPKILH